MTPVLAATRDLLTALDPLSYPERARWLAAWARTAPDTSEVGADLRTLGPYERRLALQAAVVTRDAAGVRAATGDPQPSIRTAALDAALRLGVTVPDVPARSALERRRAYRTLRVLRDHAAADALIGDVRAAYGDHEAAALLPACTPAKIRELLPELEQEFQPERLVPWHAGVLLDRVNGRLATAADADARAQVWAETERAVLRCEPGAVLDLLERYAPADRLPGDLTAYGVIAAHDPARVARLLTTPGRARWLGTTRLPRALVRRLAVLPDGDLAPLAGRLRDAPRSLAALLHALPPARRGEVYEAALAEVDRSTWEPPEPVLEVLPAAVRIEAVTRVLGRDKVRDEDEVLRWSAYLAWPDAVAALESGLRSGSAEERAFAHRRLVQAARRSRDPLVVAELIERLGRLRNEQDPVRAAALGPLAGLARLLSARTAPGLTRLTTDAVEARDASGTSTAALAALAVSTLQHHVDQPGLREWALLTIDLVSSSATVPALRRFDTVLRRGQETLVFARLRDWVGAAMDRGRYAPLFALTRALGKRARRVPELQDLLGRAAGAGTLPGVAREAVGLWLDDPRTRGDRVAEVLAVDPSAVLLPPVWETIAAVRTDLLDRVLDRAPQGRFVEGRVRWVPPLTRSVGRWLPRQQAAFVALQERVAADTGAEVWRRAGAIHAAALAPGAGRALVLRHVEDPSVVLAEAALSALSFSDRPAGDLPLLLGQAGGDRARVALYAAARLARQITPAELPGLLGPVLTGPAKVTSRKEAARLLARFGAAGVMATLLEAYADPAAHRDVRAAITSAARQRPGEPASWTILERAVAGSREERRAVLATEPYAIPERFRARYAALIVAACRATDREVRSTAYAQLPDWAPWTAGVGDLIVDRLTGLAEPVHSYEAGRLAFALAAPDLLRVVDHLAERDADDDRPGDPSADRPARRRLEAIADGAADRAESIPADTDRSAVLAAARRLATRPGFTGTAVELLTGAGRLENLDEIADACAGRPVLAVRAQQRVRTALYRIPLEADVLRDTAARLGARGDLAGGLLAVTLVASGDQSLWTWPRQELLIRLRGHPDADVREEAYACDMSD